MADRSAFGPTREKEKYPAGYLKAIFCRLLVKNCKTPVVKHSIKKTVLLNFGNLSATFCPRLRTLGLK